MICANVESRRNDVDNDSDDDGRGTPVDATQERTVSVGIAHGSIEHQWIHGPTAVITVPSASDVGALHVLIEAATGSPARRKVLAYAGRVLPWTGKLTATGLRDEATLSLLLNGCGGSGRQGLADFGWWRAASGYCNIEYRYQ